MHSFGLIGRCKFVYVAAISLIVLFVGVSGCGGGGSSTPPPAAVSVSVAPTSACVILSGTQPFTATVSNSTNTSVTWSVNGVAGGDATNGMISATGQYTAPAAAPASAVTVTATAAADTTKSANATVTVAATCPAGAAVTLSPVRVGLTTGQTQTFTAMISGTASTAVTWEVDSVTGGNSSVGTITTGGVYTPPSSPGTHSVTARSTADTTSSGSASVAITDLAGVFTYHNDLSRDGLNTKEYALTTTNVTAGTFGKRFACAIDAAAYAQPLWVANLAIGGGTHNIIIAATQHDTVYAFDADASPCHTYWQKSLLGSGETWVSSGDVGTTDITPDIGIVGTPVIDPSTQTLYVVSKSKAGGNFHQRLHAMSLIDGSEKFAGPVDIAFTSNGITFDPLRENQRCGLALVNGVVYVTYASHGDQPTYYGWVVGYNAGTLAQVATYNDDPVSGFGGIWMSGGAPAADSSNNLYVITGNGNFNGTTEFGDSFLKLSTGSGIALSSFFTPSDEGSLNSGDQDLGAGGATILVDLPSAPVPRLVIGGGKEGLLYLLNRDTLGGNDPNDAGAVQTPFFLGNGIFATPAFFQNTLYLAPIHGHMMALSLNPTTGLISVNVPGSGPPTPIIASQSGTTFGFPGSTPSISAQGTTNGIVWAIERVSGAASVLHAYDAGNLATELWSSSATAGDAAGGAVKFTVPTVANGKVYVGTATEISVYGLSPN